VAARLKAAGACAGASGAGCVEGGFMRVLLAVLCLCVPALGTAMEIAVGGVPLEIPSPEGYGLVTPKMQRVYEYGQQFVVDSNRQFASFISEYEMPEALMGQIPPMRRRFTVQTAKRLVDRKVSGSEFARLKRVLRTQNDELMEKLEREAPGIMKKINDGIEKKYDVKLALSLSQMLPFPAHEDSDDTFAFSALVTFKARDAAGHPADHATALTASLLHLRGKVLFFYAYADADDLEWTREASRLWMADVLAANPAEPGMEDEEASPLARLAHMDWRRILQRAVIVALAGGLIGVLVSLLRRRSPR
jgi:hypothetical protein